MSYVLFWKDCVLPKIALSVLPCFMSIFFVHHKNNDWLIDLFVLVLKYGLGEGVVGWIVSSKLIGVDWCWLVLMLFMFAFDLYQVVLESWFYVWMEIDTFHLWRSSILKGFWLRFELRNCVVGDALFGCSHYFFWLRILSSMIGKWCK